MAHGFRTSGDEIVRALVKQVEQDPVGAFGEIGSSDDMTATERKVFRAIGRGHVATNLPIFTHTGIPGKAAIALIDAGYAGNLLFSSDLARETFFHRNGGPGYAKTLSVSVPRLKAAGASEEVMRTIMVDNPRRFLAFVPKQARVD